MTMTLLKIGWSTPRPAALTASVESPCQDGVQPGHVMRRPRDGVRLARPGRMLDQSVRSRDSGHGRLPGDGQEAARWRT